MENQISYVVFLGPLDGEYFVTVVCLSLPLYFYWQKLLYPLLSVLPPFSYGNCFCIHNHSIEHIVVFHVFFFEICCFIP